MNAPRSCAQAARIDQDNYPELLARSLIVNPPLVFKFVWKLVRPFLDDRTKAKISVIRGQKSVAQVRWHSSVQSPSFVLTRSTKQSVTCQSQFESTQHLHRTATIFFATSGVIRSDIKKSKPFVACLCGQFSSICVDYSFGMGSSRGNHSISPSDQPTSVYRFSLYSVH